MKSKTQQIKFKGLAIIFLSCFFVLMSLSGEGQTSSQSYKIYFSSDRDGIGIYETNTNGDYVKKLSHLDYNLLSLPEVRGECNVSILDIPSATDNCMGKIIGITNDSLYYNSQGAYTINWIYDDGNNNFSY